MRYGLSTWLILLTATWLPADELDLEQATQEVVRNYDSLLVGSSLALIVLLTAIIFRLLLFCRAKTRHTQAIYDALPLDFGIIDQKHRIQFLHGYGKCAKDVAAVARAAQLDNETAALWTEQIEKTFRTGQPREFDYFAAGHRRRCRVNLVPPKLFRSQTAIWQTQEIDDLYQTGQKAAEGLRKQTIILRSVEEGVIAVDRQENITELNPAAAAICGQKQDDLMGKNLNAIIHLTTRTGSPVELPTRQALSKQQLIRIADDCCLRRPNGEIIDVSVSASPLQDESGALPGAILIIRDITEQNLAQKKIRFDNAILAQTAELGKLSYFQCTPQGKITIFRSNSAGAASPDNLPEKVEMLLPPDAREDFLRRWEAMTAGEIAELDMEYHASPTGGEPHLFHLRMLPEHDSEGDIGSFDGVIQDISDISKLTGAGIRMLAQQKAFNECLENMIRSSAGCDTMRLLLQRMADYYHADRCFLLRFDTAGQTISSVEEWTGPGILPLSGTLADGNMAQLGGSIELLTERRVLEFPSSETQKDRTLVNFLQSQGTVSLLAAGIWINGKLAGMIGLERIGTAKSFVEYDRQGIESAANIATLILEGREKQQAASIRTQIIQSIMNYGWNPLLIFNADGELAHANNAACEIARKTESELIQHAGGDLLQFSTPPAESLIPACIADGKPRSVEMTYDDRLLLVTVHPILDARGKLLSVVENATDITKQRQQEKELDEAKRSIKIVESARDAFLDHVSHELRTPLNTVIGFSELLQTNWQDDRKRQEYLDSINRAGRSLLTLIDDILDLAKMESGHLRLAPEETDLAELIRKTVNSFQAQAEQKHLAVTVDLPPFVPTLIVDPLRLRQVLQKILDNAIKFTSAGQVDIIADFYVTDRRGGNGQLKLQIKDTGPGIAPEMRERIWDKFVRNEKCSDNRGNEGGGLGLPIVKHLLQEMNGTVQMESVVGTGTTFTIFLNNVAFVGLAAQQNEIAPQAADVPEKGHLILIVEDIDMNMKLICAMLNRLHLKYETARSAKAALEIIGNRDISLVLTDVWMPNMTGEEMASVLAENPATASLPIVAITADTQVKRGLFRDVLYKPITLDRLTAVIDRILPNRDQQA